MRLVMASTMCAVLVFFTGCTTHVTKKLNQPAYYLDNDLPFQPKRIWRVHVRWQPYELNDRKAIVMKDFSLVVHDTKERIRMEEEIALRGGDRDYLRWLETELFPLGLWDMVEHSAVSRLSDMLIVVIATRSEKPVPIKTTGEKEMPFEAALTASPVAFPDLLVRALREGCSTESWERVPGPDSVGFEVVLESRKKNPFAEKWEKVEKQVEAFSLREWSVGQGSRMAYRKALFLERTIPRCPLPSQIQRVSSQFGRDQRMGIEW